VPISVTVTLAELRPIVRAVAWRPRRSSVERKIKSPRVPSVGSGDEFGCNFKEGVAVDRRRSTVGEKNPREDGPPGGNPFNGMTYNGAVRKWLEGVKRAEGKKAKELGIAA
jgi:hypothetical protein